MTIQFNSARRAAEALETPDTLMLAWMELAVERELCTSLYGGGTHGHADAETLETFADMQGLNPLWAIGFTMWYLQRAGYDTGRIDPREIADAMARYGEEASRRHIEAQEKADELEKEAA